MDGRFTQHDTILYGQFMAAIGWTYEDMRAKYGEIIDEGFTGDRVRDSLATDGIDLAVVYGPEYDMWFEGIDPELQAAMARAYNRWGAEMRESSGNHVHTSGPVPLNDVGRAVEEIQHAYHELGIRCFWSRPDQFNTRTLGDRYYDPIWELLQDLDCAFATHEFMGLRGDSFGHDRYDTFTEWHSVVHQFEAMGACMAMIVNGVFERFPQLRVSYMEAGCGWLPSWLHRVDEQLEMAGPREFPELTMSATDYFRRKLLDLHRVRGPVRGRRGACLRGRPHRLGERLPPPRLEVPAHHRGVLEPPARGDQRGDQGQDLVGQRRGPLPLPRHPRAGRAAVRGRLHRRGLRARRHVDRRLGAVEGG